MQKKHLVLILLIVLPFLWATFATPSPARAATITVDSLADNTINADGDCTLREAIQNANDDAATYSDCVAGAGADIIDFSVSGTLNFTTATEIFVTTTVVIEGNNNIVLDGGGSPAGTRFFTVASSNGNLTLNEITLQNGYSSGSAGAINVNNTSALTITNSNIVNNTADNDGGAILSSGTLIIADSVFNGNQADDDGGAIYHSSSSSMTVTASAFINNQAGVVSDADGSSGGAIFHNGAIVGPGAITASYFLNNSVDNADTADGGGAVYHGTLGILSIVGSIFLGNNANGDDARGGAVYNNSGDDAAMLVEYSHFGEFLGIALPAIPPIVVPGPDFDVVAALGIGSANTVTGTTVTTAGGGAFFNNGYLVMNGVSFIGNTSSNHGGAFANTASSTDTFPQPLGQEIIISNTTFTLNTATINGGAIYHNNPDDLMELRNVTIANNTAATGDGIFNTGDGESVGQSPFDDFYLSNTIIANDNCAGSTFGNGNASASGNNVVFNGTCDIRQQDGSSTAATPITTDPILSTPELAFNLGNIFTIVLSLGNGSSASGTGDPAICSAFPVLLLDQRNLPLGFRPQGDPNCDIGAYESDQTSPPDINVRDNADTVDITDGDATPDGADGTNFGTTTIGNPVVRTFIIDNTGSANLTVTTPITVPAGFSVTNPVTNPIAGGAQTTFTVTCTATSSGVFSGNVSIASNDPDAENPYTFAITCNVDAPEINVQGAGNNIADGDATPSVTDDTDFGTTPQGTPVTNTFTIQNLGTGMIDLNVTTITAPAGFSVTANPAPFNIASSGADVTFDVTCDAAGSGTFTGDVVIANNDSDENPYNFSVTCNVTPVGPEINVIGNSVSIVDGDNSPSLGDDTDFGPTTQGTPITRTFTIENTGNSALNLTLPITVTGDFSIVAPLATTPVASSGGTTQFTVQCDATTLTLQTGTVTIQNDDSDENPYTFDVACMVNPTAPEIDVRGNGVTIVDGDITPVLADHTEFVATTVGNPVQRTFTVHNTGTATLNIGVTIPLSFSIVLPAPSLTITPGNSTDIIVQCDAGSAAPFTGTISISNNDSDENPYTFDIRCVVTAVPVPEINILGNAVTIVDGDITPVLADHTEFVATTVGNPVSRTYTIENTGTGTLNITTPITVPAGFTVTTQPANTVTAGNTTTFTVQCDAGSANTFTGSVSITNDDSDENPYNFAINCVVTAAPVPEINILGNAVTIPDGNAVTALADHTEFVATTVGNPVSRTYTIENTGTGTLNITTPITVPAGFTVTTQPANTVMASTTTTFTVQCDAGSANTFTGSVSITNDDSDENPYNFAINCVVTAAPVPEINVTGNGNNIPDGNTAFSVTDFTDFGITPVGVPISRTFIIENTGGANLTISSVPALPAPFTITTAPAGTVLPSGTTNLIVECSSGAAATYTTTVTINNDDSDEAVYTFDIQCVVSLNAPEIDVLGNGLSILNGDITPTTLDHTDFGATSVGIGITRTFTIRNEGAVTLNLTGATPVTLTGAGAGGFTVTQPLTNAVGSGLETTFTVTCTGALQGNYVATVNIANDDATGAENPYTFNINCNVVAATGADLSLSKTVNDTTPLIGQTITYTITLSNAGPGSTTGVEVVDILPPTVTLVALSSAVTQGSFDEGTMTWTVGTMTNPSTATLTFDVIVNGNVGITTNYAQVTASSATDPNSQPNNGTPPTPVQDDEAAVSFLFDPPFGRKSFVEAGVNVLEWTIIWVNPANNPIPVQMVDPLLGGTTFITGSLSCTSPGGDADPDTTISVCQHNAGTNQIEVTAVVGPDAGATPATTLTSPDRLVIVYRVQVPANVTVVPNTATLTTPTDTIVITETYTRTVTPPPTSGGGGSGTILTPAELPKSLPATGETPLWADMLRGFLLALIPVTGLGVLWIIRRRGRHEA